MSPPTTSKASKSNQEEKSVQSGKTIKKSISFKSKDHYFKKEVAGIDEHWIDNKCGARFQVYWTGYSIPTRERSAFILSKPHGKKYLRRYLREASENARRFEYLIDREPELFELLKTEATSKQAAKPSSD